MIHLFDKSFTVSYTEDDLIIVAKDGKEVLKRKRPNIGSERELKEVAISLLSAKYGKARYYSSTEILHEFKIVQPRLSHITKELIAGYHYVRGNLANSSVLYTEAGYQAIKDYYTKKKKASE